MHSKVNAQFSSTQGTKFAFDIENFTIISSLSNIIIFQTAYIPAYKTSVTEFRTARKSLKNQKYIIIYDNI